VQKIGLQAKHGQSKYYLLLFINPSLKSKYYLFNFFRMKGYQSERFKTG